MHAAAPLFVGLGNLESRMLARRLASQTVDRPVYICGLPRAGTTITLQMLSEHPDVVTHKYADFLMPYMPYVWNKVFPRIPGRRHAQTRAAHPSRPNRGHARQRRDGRRDFVGALLSAHSRRNELCSVLDGTTSNPAFERFYSEHLRKLELVRGRTRYVSKAIMCVVRMQYLRKLFPDARFLLYVRNPVDHVASLIKQDRIWAELERDDPRQIEIIELTGHHEFGPNQVMANVGDPHELREIRRLFDAGNGRAFSRALLGLRLRLRRASSCATIRSSLAASASCATKISAPIRWRTIDRIVAHTELDPESFAATRTAYSQKLSFPDYYKPKFDSDELAEDHVRHERRRE